MGKQFDLLVQPRRPKIELADCLIVAHSFEKKEKKNLFIRSENIVNNSFCKVPVVYYDNDQFSDSPTLVFCSAILN